MYRYMSGFRNIASRYVVREILNFGGAGFIFQRTQVVTLWRSPAFQHSA